MMAEDRKYFAWDDDLQAHIQDKNNPHGVDKTDVGLGDVPNVATNNQTPTYSKASTLTNLVSGEKLSVSMGKIMKAIADLISHIANKSNPHGVTAEQVGADAKGTAASTVSSHNTNTSAHNDIRDLIAGLTSRLNALANSDDTTLDQMKEVVDYIKANRTLIESITTNKVNVTDIIDNLTTNVANKPLSAAQGVALKALIDALDTALDGKSPSSHNHSASNITSGTLSSDRLPTVPVTKGGTGATDAATALTNLGAVPLDGSKDMTGNLKINKSSYPSLVLYNGDSANRMVLQYNDYGSCVVKNESSDGFSLFEINPNSTDLDSRLQLNVNDENWYNILGAHNYKAYALALNGSNSMTGGLYQNNYSEYFSIRKARTISDGKTHYLTMGIASGGATTIEHYTCDSAAFDGSKLDARLELTSVVADRINALKLAKNATSGRFRIFGEHNKPSGTYNGNGGSQTIDTGGLGDVILVQLTGSGGGFALVTKSGAIGKLNSNNSVFALADTEAKFIGGVLTLDSSSYGVNRSGYGYNWQVL